MGALRKVDFSLRLETTPVRVVDVQENGNYKLKVPKGTEAPMFLIPNGRRQQ